MGKGEDDKMKEFRFELYITSVNKEQAIEQVNHWNKKGWKIGKLLDIRDIKEK